MLAMKRRATLVTGFTAVSIVLVVASTALACTGYRGRFTVITPGGTVTSEGAATGTNHERCSPVTSTGTPAWPANSQNVTVKIEHGTCSNLGDGVYTINYITSKMTAATNIDGFALTKYDCMNPPGPNATRNSSQGGVLLGSITVRNGVGETSDFTEPLPQTTPGEGLLCVSNAGGSFGNEVPLRFL